MVYTALPMSRIPTHQLLFRPACHYPLPPLPPRVVSCLSSKCRLAMAWATHKGLCYLVAATTPSPVSFESQPWRGPLSFKVCPSLVILSPFLGTSVHPYIFVGLMGNNFPSASSRPCPRPGPAPTPPGRAGAPCCPWPEPAAVRHAPRFLSAHGALPAPLIGMYQVLPGDVCSLSPEREKSSV